MGTENEPEAAFEPEPAPEPSAVTRQRETERKRAALECAKHGHIFYSARLHCGRCFEPRPKGWTR